MPRDIPVGNGQMLVCFDNQYRIRDLYFPHVGQENHTGGSVCRFGVWSDHPDVPANANDRRKHRVYWTEDGWDIQLGYEDDTIGTDVRMHHEKLQLKLRCHEVVDFHRPVLVRRIEIENLVDQPREVRIFHQQDFMMYGTKVGDTAYYDPRLRSLIHYRKNRYIMACFYLDGEQQIDEYATGTSGFHGAEGTWRDAEDGRLGNNPIAQGAVDSTMMTRVQVPPKSTRTVYLVIGCGENIEDIDATHQFLHRETPQGVIDRTNAYWRLWLAAARVDLCDADVCMLPPKVVDLYKRSLLTVRTQIDNDGAIIAANDSDYLQFNRDTYSYLWPRDGAFVADAIDAAGFPDIVRQFFRFSGQIIHKRGYFLHKYNPNGSPASSWHPWVDAAGRPQLPIQEDETALILWALWRHYVRYQDIEFVRLLWVSLIQKAADFLVAYRDPDTKLPLPSYDLWEERFGIHTFTVSTVYAGLKAAWQFAVCFGDTKRAARYAQAAEEVRDAALKHLWSEEKQRFVRRIMPTDSDKVAHLMAEVIAGQDPTAERNAVLDMLLDQNGSNGQSKPAAPDAPEFEVDDTIDASIAYVHTMGLLPPDDPRVEKTMQAIEERLWVKTDVGGLARYENDYYHQVSQDTDRIAGNPWFICTLWLADYHIHRATTGEELAKALPIIEWVADRALPSNVLAEQVHPETNDPLSVSPLTWSHATVVATLTAYADKYQEINGKGSNVDSGSSLGSPLYQRAATQAAAGSRSVTT